ncbi:TIGR03915 family putative DNA repair protein [Spongiimicrobium sp. 3-5]|uniref:TIGR03915 family putative DNA repair protein n=1 Tax=Spongiimicrobium sp. 3-5 TaxID=3332596 RepID=UPI00397F6C4B
MNDPKNLIYDGSFNGFLTAVFTAFDNNLNVVGIQKNSETQRGLFADTETIFTDIDKAKRVWNGISMKSNVAIKSIYFSFLSETRGIELLLFRYIKNMFSNKPVQLHNWEENTNKIDYLTKLVGREKGRTEASIRFHPTPDGIQFVALSPDFNILPLISKYFKSNMKGQPWVIYDVRRKYGLYYNLRTIEMISLHPHNMATKSSLKNMGTDSLNHSSDNLWNSYFKTTPIMSALSRKLQESEAPAKRWGYFNQKAAV